MLDPSSIDPPLETSSPRYSQKEEDPSFSCPVGHLPVLTDWVTDGWFSHFLAPLLPPLPSGLLQPVGRKLKFGGLFWNGGRGRNFSPLHRRRLTQSSHRRHQMMHTNISPLLPNTPARTYLQDRGKILSKLI